MRKTKKKSKFMIITVGILTTILCSILVCIYISYVNKEAEILEKQADYVINASNIIENDNGFYLVDVKNDVENVLKTEKIDSLVYSISSEELTLNLSISFSDNEVNVILDKVVDSLHNVSARLNFSKLKQIEFRTGNTNNSTVLCLISDDNKSYLVLVENTYYFLGTDIDELEYKSNHFYYYTYNSKYSILSTASSCSKSIKESIDDYSASDTYYSTGKINFFTDYYQKVDTKKVTVKTWCSELS